MVTQSNNIIKQGNIQHIGYLLLIKFLLPFELLSIILLVALIGVITAVACHEKILEMRVKSQALQTKEDFPHESTMRYSSYFHFSFFPYQ